tara:strand:- start:1414 stop:2553 length:1140 start_codon:yes stop_codon:yes gene_type:complete
MNILSLFDGISVARYALDLANIKVAKYYCSEIDKPAISISKKNYPNNISLGNVLNLTKDMIKEPIDLLIGGSPCQDLSIAKKDRKGLEGDRSGLFWEYVRLKNELQPKWFILENVASMPKKDKDIISQAMGCEPVMFNASLVSAQCRKRLFWTNIPFELPDDRGIVLKDILEPNSDIDERMVNKNKKAYTLTASYKNVSATESQIKNSVEKKQRTMMKVGSIDCNYNQGSKIYSDEGKSCSLSARGGGIGCTTGLYKVITRDPKDSKGLFITDDDKLAVVEGVKKGYAIVENNQSIDLSYANCKTMRRGRVGDKVKNIMTSNNIYVNQNYNIRKLTPIECERLQSLPDNYTEGVAMTNRYKCLGNAFNADVIAHILMHI